MKDYNVEISFTDKNTGEKVLSLSLDDLNQIQESVMKAKVGLEAEERAEDKLVESIDIVEALEDNIAITTTHIYISVDGCEDQILYYRSYNEIESLRFAVQRAAMTMLRARYGSATDHEKVCDDMMKKFDKYARYIRVWMHANPRPFQPIGLKVESNCITVCMACIDSKEYRFFYSNYTYIDDMKTHIISNVIEMMSLKYMETSYMLKAKQQISDIFESRFGFLLEKIELEGMSRTNGR